VGKNTSLPERLVVFFDGSCDFCTRCVRMLRSIDRRSRISWVPFQNPARAQAGLTLEACEQAVWAVAPDGSRWRAAAAVNRILAVILDRSFPVRIYEIPGMRSIQEWAYRLIAAHRHRLPGDIPYCQQHPEACRDASGVGRHHAHGAPQPPHQ
jgi:predicted DCC family thiol-disulfide oxidoreductase YuxK